MINLDTNIVIFAVQGEHKPQEAASMDGAPWAISPIVYWELALQISRGSLPGLTFDDQELNDLLGRLAVLPLTMEVARLSQEIDINRDPADRLIVATSIVYEVPLLTRDSHIRRPDKVPLADDLLD